jgi:hypothetical protein
MSCVHRVRFRSRAVFLVALAALLPAIPLGTSSASTPLTPGFGRSIGQFEFSVDGQRVFFTAQSRASGPHPYELFSTPIGGGPIQQITPAPANPDRDVFPFSLTSDGHTIVYRQSDHPDDGDLFSIPTSGGPVTQLTTTYDASGAFSDTRFWLTPSGDRAVYIRHFLKGNPNPRDTRDLMSVPVDGHAPPVQLNSLLPGFVGSVTDVALLPDGQYAIYIADQELDTRRDLFRVPVAGGSPVRINDVAGPRQNALIPYVLNEIGDSIIYRTNGASPTSRQRLYATPVFAGPETPLATELPNNIDVDRFEYSADERQVLFTTYGITPNKYDLFSAPLDGGPMVRLTAGTPAGLGVDDASVTPLVYQGDSMVAFRTHDSDGYSSFYLGAIDDPNPSLLGRLSTPRGIVPPFSLSVTPRGDYLFVRNNSSTTPYAHLFPLNGDPMIPLGLMNQYLFHTDGIHMIYSGGGFINAAQLYWQHIGDPASATRITDDSSIEDIAYFLLSPDGANVLYKRGLYSGSSQSIYVASLPIAEPSTTLLCAILCVCVSTRRSNSAQLRAS